MTVTYTAEVSTSRGFGCFLQLLGRWKGSIYKLVWLDLTVYLLAYYVINLVYRFALEGEYLKAFELVVTYCSTYANLIPLSFVLGFYVNMVVTRWWNQYSSIPYPDNLAILVSAILQGQHERSRLVRRTIVRYVCLTFAMTMSMVSPSTKKRFPTMDHFVEAGLMHKDEKRIVDDLEREYPSYTKYWIPLAWAANVVTKARSEGLIRDDIAVKALLNEINAFRTKCGTILDYDWISIPLVYTQVVTLAVYFYFITTLIGRQSLEIYFPVLTILEYFFYVGWLKVAETMINPFGEDDDDFEVCWIIDRHVQVTYLIVDKMHSDHPELIRDQYWSKTAPNVLPYTVASEKFIKEHPCHSTSNLKINTSQSEMFLPDERRITGERVDGVINRRGSFLSKLFSNKLQQRQMNHDLSKINEVPLNEVPSPVDCEETYDCDCTEFESLKAERMRRMQNKMKAVLHLLKVSDEAGEDSIINEITHPVDN